MFQKDNKESKKGGKKSYKTLVKRLGSDEAISKHFRKLRMIRQKKRLERIKKDKNKKK
jgi:hypothetical protein